MKVFLKCSFCKNDFERAAYQHRGNQKAGKGIFCSRTCYHSSLTGREKIERAFLTCEGCGVVFERRATEQARLISRGVKSFFCSKECKYTKQTIDLPLCIIDEYKLGKSLKFIATQYQVSSNTIQQFLEHHGIERRNKTSQWTSEFCRTKNYEKLEKGFSFLTSKLEDIVALQLEKMGVSFERQKPIRGKEGRYIACADFLLSDGRVMEVNGTYWHCDPRAYPNGPEWESQKSGFISYPQKVARLKAEGIQVIEVWEIDIQCGCEKALKDALCELNF